MPDNCPTSWSPRTRTVAPVPQFPTETLSRKKEKEGKERERGERPSATTVTGNI
jgi:hypothetical protein